MEKWLAVKLHNHTNVPFPVLVTIDPNDADPERFHWFGGYTWSRDTYDILREYPSDQYKDGYGNVDGDAIEIAFHHDYPPQTSKPVRSAGWIAPGGQFYVCKPWEHDALAKRLTALYFNVLTGTHILEVAGWIRLYWNGLCAFQYDTARVTQKQLDAAGDLLLLCDEPEWCENIQTFIEITSR